MLNQNEEIIIRDLFFYLKFKLKTWDFRFEAHLLINRWRHSPKSLCIPFWLREQRVPWKRGVHNVQLLRHNGPKMLLIKCHSRVPTMNNLLDLPKHAIKGFINISMVMRVSINISNDPHNRVNEAANISANASKLKVRNIINYNSQILNNKISKC